MSKNKEKMQLVEDIGLRIEDRFKLSPVASRIYALLILSSFDGLTFEEIRETINASKSSTSVNMNVLLQLGYIKSITKPGVRKRYFKISKYSSLQSLEQYYQAIGKEMEMLVHINSFNKKYHPEKFMNEKSLGLIFQDYLEKKQQLVKLTIDKMKNFRENEK